MMMNEIESPHHRIRIGAFSSLFLLISSADKVSLAGLSKGCREASSRAYLLSCFSAAGGI
jgi:hypothetical protein